MKTRIVVQTENDASAIVILESFEHIIPPNPGELQSETWWRVYINGGLLSTGEDSFETIDYPTALERLMFEIRLLVLS